MRLLIFPGRYRSDNWKNEYIQAYELYETVWSATYTELQGKPHRHFADGFIHQDYVLALFLGSACLALEALSWVDLQNPVELRQKWLRNWPSKVFETLESQGYRLVCINSNLIVDPKHRRPNLPHIERTSFIMAALTTLFMVHRKIPLSLGMTRKDRSIDKIFKATGASVLMDNQLHNGIPTDLIGSFLHQIRETSQTFPSSIKAIFDDSMDLTTKGENYGNEATIA